MGKGPKSPVQWLRVQSWRALGLLTAPMRVLPDFLIIGALKAGTTSLYQYLKDHPKVNPPFKKEIKFYNCLYHRGYFWYRSFFPTAGRMRSNGGSFITGEASPNYLFHPKTPQRVAQRLPHVKLIVLLRNPVTRAYSHYQMNLRNGVESLSFEEAIAAEPGRLEGEYERIIADDRYPLATFRRYAYLYKGYYAQHLSRWFEYFPREAVLIIRSEDFFADPGTVYAETLAFLGLPAWHGASFKAFSSPGGYPPMGEDTRRYLNEHFTPHNEQLYALLGRDFGWEH
jgi:hypothetical protein